MRRYSVSDEVWARIEPLFPHRGNKVDNRLFFDAVYWVAKSGAPWRDLPERFGKWNSVFSRFNRLAKAGLWQRIFEASTVRVHQQAANGAKKSKAEAAIGRSRGGLTSKIHLATDGYGSARRIIVGLGQEHDSRRALALLDGFRPAVLIADKAYDNDALLAYMAAAGVNEQGVPTRCNRRKTRPLNKELYKNRNRIERCFNRFKNFRRVATRYDKSARNFTAFTCFAATIINYSITLNTA